jgi:hypothetical protein
MRNFLILAFKTKCRALLERFWKPETLVITRHHVPVAGRSAWIGSMSDSIELVGAIISPPNEESEWEALRD